MSEDFNLDDPLDAAGEGLSAPTDADLAQDFEDRQAGASQTDTATEEAEGDEYEYETPDGKVVKLSAEQAEAVQDMLDAQEKAATLEAELEALKAKATETKPAEAPVQGDVEGFEPVQWGEVGENFQAMLEGEQGGTEAIGPALHNVVLRTIATDPIIADVVGRYIDYRVSQREQGAKVENTFKEFVGGDIPDSEVAAFTKANPWAHTKEMAVVGIKAARLQQELADLKAGKKTELAKAEKEGGQKTVKAMKAKGQLRRLTTGGNRGATSSAATNTKKGLDLTNENDRLAGAVAKLHAMRQGRGT